MERIDREMREQFPTETSRLDRAVESFEEGKGRQIYAPEQHQERLTALLDKLDASLESVNDAALAAIEKSKGDLAKVEGFDPFDRLTSEQKQAASTRAAFIKEDVETLPAAELAKLARAALASSDKVRIYLYGRYLARRISPVGPDGLPSARARGSADLELLAVARDLNAVFEDGSRPEKRREIERRIESAKVLSGQVHRVRTSADGSAASREAAIRRQYASAV